MLYKSTTLAKAYLQLTQMHTTMAGQYQETPNYNSIVNKQRTEITFNKVKTKTKTKTKNKTQL